MNSNNKDKSDSGTKIFIYSLVSLVALALGAVAWFYLSIGEIRGTIQANSWQGREPLKSHVNVIAVKESDLRNWLDKQNTASEDVRAQLRLEYAQLSRIANIPMVPKPPSMLEQVGDITAGVMTMGAWLLIKPSLQTDQKAAAWSAQDRYWKLSVWPVAGYYFGKIKELPVVSRAYTDASGNYKLVVPRGQPLVILAHTQYAAPQQLPPQRGGIHFDFTPPDRQLFWAVPSRLDSVPVARIELKDDNTTEHKSSSAIYATCYDFWK